MSRKQSGYSQNNLAVSSAAGGGRKQPTGSARQIIQDDQDYFDGPSQ